MAKKWYVLCTYSGYEKKVKTDIEMRVETMGLENNVFAVEIPMETVTGDQGWRASVSIPRRRSFPAMY